MAGASNGAAVAAHAASGGGGGAEKEISIGALMVSGPSCAREVFLGFWGNWGMGNGGGCVDWVGKGTEKVILSGLGFPALEKS